MIRIISHLCHVFLVKIPVREREGLLLFQELRETWSQFVIVFNCQKMQRDIKWDIQEHLYLDTEVRL